MVYFATFCSACLRVDVVIITDTQFGTSSSGQEHKGTAVQKSVPVCWYLYLGCY